MNNKYETPESDIAIQQFGTTSLSVKEVLFSFSGRVGRKTYWMFFLGFIAVLLFLVFAISLAGLSETTMSGLIIVLYIPAIWMSLAVQVKRWHDRDKSGWWVLISFIPLIGPIWAFVENGCLAGTSGENRFGLPNA